MKTSRICQHCGTVWEYETKSATGSGTGWSGFLEARLYIHRKDCKNRTQEQRKEWMDKTRKRLKKRPNKYTRLVFPDGGDAAKEAS